MATRLDPKDRKKLLALAAVRAAEKYGWRAVTRDQIAEEAGVSGGLVTTRLGTMDVIRKTVMRQAVKDRIAKIVAEGLIEKNPEALKADADLVAEARKTLF